MTFSILVPAYAAAASMLPLLMLALVLVLKLLPLALVRGASGFVLQQGTRELVQLDAVAMA